MPKVNEKIEKSQQRNRNDNNKETSGKSKIEENKPEY